MGYGRLREIQDRLLQWFAENKRDLPWRTDYSPYKVWISEIMLQQTQVRTVLPYFRRWMKRFPDIPSIAYSSDEELFKYWEGLGYYTRVKNIQRTAQILMRDFGGEFPRNHGALLALPGIGRYTAGALMSFAFNEDYPAVDGNVERVLARVFNIASPIRDKESQVFIWNTAKELIPSGRARDFNQALMELGAVICLPRSPLCARCPLRGVCESFRLGNADQRPVVGKRKATVAIEAAIGILVHGEKILIQKRPATGLMANLWEFPGGKIRNGETPEEALIREFHEELELEICCLDKIAAIRHAYTSFRVILHAFFCRLRYPDQTPIVHSAVDVRWVTREALDHFAFPAANRKLIRLL